jgi:hypothetical protein
MLYCTRQDNGDKWGMTRDLRFDVGPFIDTALLPTTWHKTKGWTNVGSWLLTETIAAAIGKLELHQ